LKKPFQHPSSWSASALACGNQKPRTSLYRVHMPHKCQGMSLLMPSRSF
jgi:hypothetical protein